MMIRKGGHGWALAFVGVGAALAATVIVWVWPRGPEPVVVGTVDAPAEYGQEFRVVSDDGEVRSGTVLGVTAIPGPAGLGCFQVVGTLHWQEGTRGDDGDHEFRVQLLTSEGIIDPAGAYGECDMGAFSRDAELLGAYGDGYWDGELGLTGVFFYGFAVPSTATVDGVVISGEPIDAVHPVDDKTSIFEFRVTRTLDEDGVAQ